MLGLRRKEDIRARSMNNYKDKWVGVGVDRWEKVSAEQGRKISIRIMVANGPVSYHREPISMEGPCSCEMMARG